jgi:hypothetical protein
VINLVKRHCNKWSIRGLIEAGTFRFDKSQSISPAFCDRNGSRNHAGSASERGGTGTFREVSRSVGGFARIGTKDAVGPGLIAFYACESPG